VRVLDAQSQGKFLIVSLLQAHVLDALLDFFVRGTGNPYFQDYIFDLELRRLEKICDVKDSKFVSFLLCFSKRPRDQSAPLARLTLKERLDVAAETLAEAELTRRVKVLQYQAMISTDVKEFKMGQVF